MSNTEDMIPAARGAHFYNLPEEPPLFYVNAWQVRVTASEVTIQLGHIVQSTREEDVIRKSASIVLTHESFAKLADSVEQSLKIVKIIHGGEMPPVVNPSEEQVAEIWREIPSARSEPDQNG